MSTRSVHCNDDGDNEHSSFLKYFTKDGVSPTSSPNDAFPRDRLCSVELAAMAAAKDFAMAGLTAWLLIFRSVRTVLNVSASHRAAASASSKRLFLIK